MSLKKNLPPVPQHSKFAAPWVDGFSWVFYSGSVMSINLAHFAASAGPGVAFGVTGCCCFFSPFGNLSNFLKNLHRLVYAGIWLLQRSKAEGSKGGRGWDLCPRQLWMWKSQCSSSLGIARMAGLCCATLPVTFRAVLCCTNLLDTG